MRRLIPLLVFAAIAAGCGDGSVATTLGDAPAGATSEATDTTTRSDGTAGTTQPPTATPPASATTTPGGPQLEGPAAPDFTMALADGSSFTLSEAPHPVYMVFWAEW